jgi:hypothetical protein
VKLPPEPEITIGGQRLTYAQAMTLRVAISRFAMEMDDAQHAAELGPQLARNYRDRAREIERAMLESVRSQERPAPPPHECAPGDMSSRAFCEACRLGHPTPWAR